MHLNIQLDRQFVPVTGSSERYLLVKLAAPEHTRPVNRLPLNLALVIDRSGSMAGSKLHKAKEAASACVRNLSPADRIAIVAYDDEVKTIATSDTLTPNSKNQMVSAINTIECGGTTNLGGGWLKGAEHVAEHVAVEESVSRVILLSDGLANVGITDPRELAHHAFELRQRGVSTTTMGVGADFDEELLEGMAVAGGGSFYFIENARQILDILQREQGELLTTSARRVTLDVKAPRGVEVELLNTFDVHHNGQEYTIRLGDMFASEERSLLFKLRVQIDSQPTSEEVLPLHVTVGYLDVSSNEERTLQATATLTRASRTKCDSEIPDPEVLEAVAVQEAAHAREQALQYDAQGLHELSASTLSETAAMLRRMAPASPVIAKEADTLADYSEKASQGLTSMARKAMHYERSARRRSRKE